MDIMRTGTRRNWNEQ